MKLKIKTAANSFWVASFSLTKANDEISFLACDVGNKVRGCGGTLGQSRTVARVRNTNIRVFRLGISTT